MKKNVLRVLSGILLAGLIMGCNPIDRNDDNNDGVQPTAAQSYIGDVNRIFYPPNYPGAGDNARYFTGQVIDWDGQGTLVRFEGNLIEYNSIKQSILDYVDGLTSNNALMHQNYDGVTYNSDKKYVELSSYTNIETDEVVAYDVRIFFGNFLKTFEESHWYAKSITFNPTFTKNMDTGEELNFD